MISEELVEQWCESVALRLFTHELSACVGGAGLSDAFRESATLLARAAREDGVRPEDLLQLVKGACDGLPTVDDDRGYADSTDRSRCYAAAMDVLWEIYFAPPGGNSPGEQSG